jgi:uroporphyrinogen-III synthase
MRLLVTRPGADGAALAARLQALGHAVLVSPVLRIEPVAMGPIAWNRLGGVIFTSRNAVAASGPYPPDALALRAWAVGNATAEAARGAGFAEIVPAGGTAADLAEMLLASPGPPPKPLLHLRGEETRFDLAGRLRAGGIEVEDRIAYASRLADDLTPAAVAALRGGRLDGVILLSPRTARHFLALARKSGVAGSVARLVAYCISGATAAEIDHAAGRVEVAHRPDLEHVLALLAPRGRQP